MPLLQENNFELGAVHFDFSTLRFDTEYQTTVDWSVIDNDGTGTAISIVATFFTAG